MATKLLTLFVVALFAGQAYAMLIRPALPNKLLLSITTPMPTPSMVDLQTWNFTHPGDFAKQCLNRLNGQSVVDLCQKQALKDWDPDKIGTSKSTTWETCCSLFDELDCYTKNAANFCPTATGNAVVAYARKVATYFHLSICKSVSFIGWKSACNNDTHAVRVQRHNETMNKYPNLKPNFITLPTATGPEKVCFQQLRTFVGNDKVKVNLEQKCLDTSLNKWDPSRRKLLESGIIESCCAIYDTLDCIQHESSNACNATQVNDMASYRKQSLVALSSTICKTVPSDQKDKLCNQQAPNVPTTGSTGKPGMPGQPKGGANAAMPSLSIVSIVSLLIFFGIRY